MVGAGGIGCELLKTLVLTGFKHIHVVTPSAGITKKPCAVFRAIQTWILKLKDASRISRFESKI